MHREFIEHYSRNLNRMMHILVHGHGGVPVLAFPCQDSMCDNYEDFGMIDTIADFINDGKVQIFTVDTVDKESWSDTYGNKGHRAWVQECYFKYIVEEAIPFIMGYNGTGALPIAMGCSLGATHAAICFFRRPDLFSGSLSMSGLYDATSFFDGWCDGVLYENSPVSFLSNMPSDHEYIGIYNQKKIVICAGQGAWEDQGLPSVHQMRDICQAKGINAWIDLWGYDVSHDWPWWKEQIRYFIPYLIG